MWCRFLAFVVKSVFSREKWWPVLAAMDWRVLNWTSSVFTESSRMATLSTKPIKFLIYKLQFNRKALIIIIIIICILLLFPSVIYGPLLHNLPPLLLVRFIPFLAFKFFILLLSSVEMFCGSGFLCRSFIRKFLLFLYLSLFGAHFQISINILKHVD